jgi:hypothetical protein
MVWLSKAQPTERGLMAGWGRVMVGARNRDG